MKYNNIILRIFMWIIAPIMIPMAFIWILYAEGWWQEKSWYDTASKIWLGFSISVAVFIYTIIIWALV